MNTPQQKAPLPAATMPWGFTTTPDKPWEPPAEYGAVTSPKIVPTAVNWPNVPPPSATIAPSFTTTTGQQLNTGQKVEFVFFGTWGRNAGNVQGFLRNPYDQGNMYGWPPNTPSIEYSQVEAAGNWQQSPSEFVPMIPPGPAPATTNEALRDQAVALLQKMQF